MRNKLKQERFMRQAIRLALRAKGKTFPNPLVGAVVVKKGKVVGQGYHRAAGCAHAEEVALTEAGRLARGASLYVNLEPCCHFGQTPPCVHRIIDYGIKEIIFAMYDPNPLNQGRGARFLRRKGVKVVSGILEDEARRINQIFIKYISSKLPYVTVKVAQSLDGKIATASGDACWISSSTSRGFAHKLRSQADAVLVGINTVLKDNPLLSCRLNGRLFKKQPKKIILDSKLRLRPNLKIFSSRSPAPVVIATTRFASPAKINYFRSRAQVIVVKDEQKKVDLKDLLQRLASEGISHVLVEGGGEIIASALRKKLVDRMIMVFSNKIIGGRTAPTAVEGQGVSRVNQALRLKDLKLRRTGSELTIEGKPDYKNVYRNN